VGFRFGPDGAIKTYHRRLWVSKD